MKKKIAGLGKAVLAVGMLLYLGKHSLSFFQFTFKGEDEIYAWLGLLTTSVGVLIWLSMFLWLSESTLQKTTAAVMVVVSLLGEFGVAGFDMYMNAMGLTQGGVHFSDAEIRNMSIVVAGLALLNGLALIIDIAGDEFDRVWSEEFGKSSPAKQAPASAPFSPSLPAPFPLPSANKNQSTADGVELKEGNFPG